MAALLFAVPAAGQDAEPAELEDWERDELRTLLDAVGDVLEGDAMLSESPFELAPSFLKGTDGNTYVPFTLSIDPARLEGASSVAVYLYVDDPLAEEDDDREAVFEDAYFVDVEAGDDGPIRLSRAFSAPGGDYDVYVALRRSLGEDPDDDERDAAQVMILGTSVAVPDLWTDQLATSTVLVAETIEPLPAPLSPRQQIENPYTLGTTRIVPRHGELFTQQDELSLLMLVYNPRLTSDEMPNVTVEFNFHKTTDGVEEFFNKTNPQEFNATTLPPGFSVAAGHQIVAGQSIPLRLFQPGQYRLEILVTDREAGSSVTRNVNFTIEEA